MVCLLKICFWPKTTDYNSCIVHGFNPIVLKFTLKFTLNFLCHSVSMEAGVWMCEGSVLTMSPLSVYMFVCLFT